MPQEDDVYSQKMQDELIATNVIIEMAKADGFIDPSVPMQDARMRETYDHYIGCFLRALHRMVKRGECAFFFRKKSRTCH